MEQRWRDGLRAVKGWLVSGLFFGLTVVALMHNSDLIGRIAGYPLPGDTDPLRRVRGYQAAAACVEQARERLLQEGKPTFIICDHYGIMGLFSFYLAEARRPWAASHWCIACFIMPNNQLYFWPEYRYAIGIKAKMRSFVTEPGLPPGTIWPWKWLTGQEISSPGSPPAPPPPLLLEEFDSVTDLGVHEVKVKAASETSSAFRVS